MTTLAAAVAAPVEITIGGRPFKLSPIRLIDAAEYELWAQRRAVDLQLGPLLASLAGPLLADAAAALDLSQPDRARALARARATLTEAVEDAIARVLSVGFYGDACQGSLDTIQGSLLLAWLGVRALHPSVTREWVAASMTRAELQAAARAYVKVNYPEAQREDAAPANPPPGAGGSPPTGAPSSPASAPSASPPTGSPT